MNIASVDAPNSLTRFSSLVDYQVEDAHQLARGMHQWDQSFEQLTPGKFQGRFTLLKLDTVLLYCEQSNQAIYETGYAQRQQRAFAIPLASEGEHAVFRGHVVESGQLTMLGPDHEIDFRTPKQLQLLGITLPEFLLREWLPELEALNEEKLPILYHKDNVSVQAFSRFLQLLLSQIRTKKKGFMPNQLWQQTLLDQLSFALIPILSEPFTLNSKPIYAPRQRIVRRAREYIYEHLQTPLTVAQLCQHTHTSRRTLQYSFETMLGVSPLAYLQAVRLSQARQSLQNPEFADQSILQIAEQWGFWHLSHFRSHYKKMFAETPSETRKRLRWQ